MKIGNKMKQSSRFKSFLFVGVYVLFFLLPVLPVYASEHLGSGGGGGNPSTLPNPLSEINSFSDFVAAILNIVLQIGVPIAAIAIIFSGFLFLKAQGNEEELKTAKSALTWSVVGTAVLLGAWTFAEAIRVTIDVLR